MTRAPKSPRSRRPARQPAARLEKTPSGIQGLDEITSGGLPRGRPTLVCGGPGCGKTLFALEFLIRGATEHGEPGVFMSFEESEEELAANVASLGFDLRKLVADKKLYLDQVRVERQEIEETGEYDLEGLFVRMQYAIDAVGAKRVALDTIESLFSSMPNPGVLRSELRRLFRWLKDRGLTAVITGEKGEGTLTRQGLEEYISDCVISLDHRLTDQISTRRLRVVKYRGTTHGTNEYPFLIDEAGFSVLPITSLGLKHRAYSERVSTGVPRLDEMLGGHGYFKASSVLVSGAAGTGKTSLAAALARATCQAGGTCAYFAFEESPEQLIRNMRSIGIDLAPFIRSGALQLIASRPYTHGLEMHLVTIHKRIKQLDPTVVIIDPVTNFMTVGTRLEARSMLTRLIDFIKHRGTTALFTSLTPGGADLEQSEVEISSIIDTWLMLEMVRSGGERNRVLNIIKSRGMAHSNQTSEYILDASGMHLLDTYLGPSGVLTGSARVAREAEEVNEAAERAQRLARTQKERERRRQAFEGRLQALREEFEADDAELARTMLGLQTKTERMSSDRQSMARARRAFSPERAATSKGARR